MGKYKSTIIQFEGKIQTIEDLVSRARFYAQTNRAYSLEIILHLQDHAYQYNDSVLFDLCRELMMFVQSPSPYPANNSKQRPADVNNLPNHQLRSGVVEQEHIPAEIRDNWDDQYDDVFNPKIEPQKVFEELEYIDDPHVTEYYPRFFVFYKVLLYIGWIEKSRRIS